MNITTHNITKTAATAARTTVRTACRRVLAALLVLVAAVTAGHAFSLDRYAANSVLSSGRWVKVSVSESGLYTIPASALRSWGLGSAKDVRVHGYGALRPVDRLTESSYVDDLPQVQTHVTDRGDLVFWANGPLTWRSPVANRYVGVQNLYTTAGYYYITANTDSAARAIPATGQAGAAEPRTTFMERLHHEQELVSPGESGGVLMGEDFRYTPQRSFDFAMPDRADGGTVWMECSFVARTLGQGSDLSFTANGATVEALTPSRVGSTSAENYYHGTEGQFRGDIPGVSGDKLTIGIRHSSSATVHSAWLNYLSVNYERKLALPRNGGWLTFQSQDPALRLDGTAAGTVVWDVTDPFNVLRVDGGDGAQGSMSWTVTLGGPRQYAAFNSNAQLPQPTYCGAVTNQDLHSHESVNMVIFTHRQWDSQARRIAAIHTAEGLSVRVVDVEQAYAEFSSGSPDINGLRRYLKMLYDRGQGTDNALRYVLLMGHSTIDNRHLTAELKDAGPSLPNWVVSGVRESLNDNDGYTTDDFLAMLGDDSGQEKGVDQLSVAVGRIPVHTLAEATSYVDKLEQYIEKSKNTPWRNQVMIVCDNGDQNIHLTQSETMTRQITNNPGQQFMLNKVYLDAYPKVSGNVPKARAEMFRLLDEGVLWWTYIGHANNHSMTADGQLTYNDIMTMYLKKLPILYAATCDFLRWDSSTLSGGEILFNERYGGIIAAISATRPVFIHDNGLFSAAMGRQLGAREADGRYGTLGDVYRRAKNDIRSQGTNGAFGNRISNMNRLRYVLMGDPAMRMAMPDNNVELTDVDGIPAEEGPEAPMVSARQTAMFNGVVTGPDGTVLDDFNGTLTATVYDAEESVTTLGFGDGSPTTFDRIGGKLFAGATRIENGHFSLRVTIPDQITDNYRPATINMYAVPDDSLSTGGRHSQAIGLTHNFYVSGYDETAARDSVAPVIDALYLNHPSFADGGLVNSTPLAIANVSDDHALNLSAAGVGRNMRLNLDGTTDYNDVSQYYTPASDGSASGTIAYPLPELREGPHQLTLRVCDADGNVATKTIAFTVSNSAAPKIYDVYSDANPASTQANFYLTHDRPDQMVTVTVGIYNLLGAPIWTKTVTGVSDMFTSTPVSWDLCDGAGHRVPRGIYLYRATISCGSDAYDTATHRIAVTN